MGIYLNPGAKAFQEAINSEIYVDKTAMIYILNTLLNTQQKYKFPMGGAIAVKMEESHGCSWCNYGSASADYFA